MVPFLDLALGQDPIVLTHVPPESGIDFRHTDGSGGQRYVVETVASGVATFDYDGDGLIDVYFLNGAPLRGTQASSAPTNRLYRNLGGFRFADVTEKAGVGDTGYGLGVAVGDYDNDGYPDIYLSNFGPNVMYRNNGDGTFQEMAKRVGTSADDDSKVGAGTNFLDMDADGDLDLFVSNYLKFTYDDHVTNFFHGFPVYAGPENFDPLPARLFQNSGDGTFADVSDRLQINPPWGKGMGTVCADYDGDGDTDIVVGNDGRPGNFLFQNDGTGIFEDVGWFKGIAFQASGVAPGSMGVACGDYNNDLRLDFLVSNYQGELTTLFESLPGGLFDDVTLRTGAGQMSHNHVTWGNGLIDFDNDGHRDVFFARGHLLDNVERYDSTTSYLACPVLLRNTGDGEFLNMTDRCGDLARFESVGRGAAFDDLDNDGRIDVVILNSRRLATILRNESPPINHWVQVHLHAVTSSRQGIGARVTVTAGDLVQLDEVHSGHGYQSHYGTRLHFGLGKHHRVDRIEVQWIGGGVNVLRDIDVNRVVTIVEHGTQSQGDVPQKELTRAIR